MVEFELAFAYRRFSNSRFFNSYYLERLAASCIRLSFSSAILRALLRTKKAVTTAPMPKATHASDANCNGLGIGPLMKIGPASHSPVDPSEVSVPKSDK